MGEFQCEGRFDELCPGPIVNGIRQDVGVDRRSPWEVPKVGHRGGAGLSRLISSGACARLTPYRPSQYGKGAGREVWFTSCSSGRREQRTTQFGLPSET